MRNLDRYDGWLDTLPKHLRGRAIDFAHCELWVPTTNHVFYNALPSPFMVNPFSDRRLIVDTARMSFRFRKNRRPQNHIMRTFAPELRGIPYMSRDLKEMVGQSRFLELTGRNWR